MNELTKSDKDWIEHNLRKLDFVQWDRFGIRANNVVSIYGWIERAQDSYKDFVLLLFFTRDHVISYVSSSEKYSKKIHSILYNSESDSIDSFVDCVRVEDEFDIKNCIRIGDD